MAFRIPLNGCGSWTQMRLESPGETFGSQTGDLSPQQAPQFEPARLLSPDWLYSHRLLSLFKGVSQWYLNHNLQFLSFSQ